jgi:methionine aminopeptidase
MPNQRPIMIHLLFTIVELEPKKKTSILHFRPRNILLLVIALRLRAMPYDKEELEKFRKSGRILRETREEMRSFVHEGMPIIDICEKVEGTIRAKGGKPAFPCNVSINEVAAHYTSPPNDKALIPEGSTVKVDLGVQIDGYVTDTAFTAAFNPEGRSMANTAELALKTANRQHS